MRKLFNLFAAALVMLVAVSCNKNEVFPDNTSNENVVTLKATINNGETKTSLGGEKGDDDKYPVLWSEGDQIAVVQRLSGESTRIFQFTLSEGKNTANGTFTCNSAGNFDPSEQFEALYPYNAIENLVIPQNQNYAEESFGQGAMIMYAKNTNGGNSLVFDNTLGVLKLTLKGVADEEVSSIELNASAPISGEASIEGGDIGGNKILVVNEESGYKNIILSCPNVPIADETEFLITLTQGTYDFSVTINTNKGVYYKSTTDKTVTASNILKMSELNLEGFANKMSYVENGVYLGEGIALQAGNDKTIIWAPVNCGYEPANGEYKGYPYGKLYQWGRKDGQGCSEFEAVPGEDDEEDDNEDDDEDDEVFIEHSYDASTPTISTEDIPTTLDANTFYTKWEPTATEWPAESNPCPNGWRVPTIEELGSLNGGYQVCDLDGISGIWVYDNKVFFPIAGYRKENGTAWGRQYKETGMYWSSNNPEYMIIEIGATSYGVQTYNDESPTCGFSVRCVKDTPQSEPMPSDN